MGEQGHGTTRKYPVFPENPLKLTRNPRKVTRNHSKVACIPVKSIRVHLEANPDPWNLTRQP